MSLHVLEHLAKEKGFVQRKGAYPSKGKRSFSILESYFGMIFSIRNGYLSNG
jgi:hypothetical protein